jgi:hypothetical protein
MASYSTVIFPELATVPPLKLVIVIAVVESAVTVAPVAALPTNESGVFANAVGKV